MLKHTSGQARLISLKMLPSTPLSFLSVSAQSLAFPSDEFPHLPTHISACSSFATPNINCDLAELFDGLAKALITLCCLQNRPASSPATPLPPFPECLPLRILGGGVVQNTPPADPVKLHSKCLGPAATLLVLPPLRPLSHLLSTCHPVPPTGQDRLQSAGEDPSTQRTSSRSEHPWKEHLQTS